MYIKPPEGEASEALKYQESQVGLGNRKGSLMKMGSAKGSKLEMSNESRNRANKTMVAFKNTSLTPSDSVQKIISKINTTEAKTKIGFSKSKNPSAMQVLSKQGSNESSTNVNNPQDGKSKLKN